MNEDLERVRKQMDYLVEQAGASRHHFLDARKIADILQSQDITGRIGSPNSCPIAVYLTKETGMQVRVSACAAGLEGGEETIGVPPAISAFVAHFDAAHYPQLVNPDDWAKLQAWRAAFTK